MLPSSRHRRQRCGQRAVVDVVFFMLWSGPLLATRAGIATSATGGAETQMWLLARELKRRGNEVAIATFDRPRGLPGTVDGIQIIRLPARPRGASVRYQALWVLRFAVELGRVDGRVFVQRGANVITGIVGLLARLRRRRFVYSTSAVTDFASPRMGWMAAQLFRLGVQLADTIVVQSDEQVDLCRRHWSRSSTVIRSLADGASPRRATPEAFLWVGRLAPIKRPDMFAELAARMPNARFWMVGAPSPHDAEAPERLGRATNLELISPRSRSALAPFFDRAVAVVSTSVEEGMPNVFLEGWARGVPALTLSCDPDGVIERHGLGWNAKGSVERLAELATAVWVSRMDQAEIAERCRTYIAREHAPHRIAACWERVLGLGTTMEA